jgi:excisionase family DNA binding protein
MPRKNKLEEKTYPDILNLSELKSYLRISHSTALGLISSGQIPARKIGREWRVCKQDIINWIRFSEVEGGDSLGPAQSRKENPS